MLKAWAEVWFILVEGHLTLGFLRIYRPSKAEGMSAMVRFVGVGQPARQLIRCAMR